MMFGHPVTQKIYWCLLIGVPLIYSNRVGEGERADVRDQVR